MVNATNSAGYQQPTVQPAIVDRQPDPPVRQETVQPRQGPAADSQRADRRESNERPPPESGRGQEVDVRA